MYFCCDKEIYICIYCLINIIKIKFIIILRLIRIIYVYSCFLMIFGLNDVIVKENYN